MGTTLAGMLRRESPARNVATTVRPPHVSAFAVSLARRLGTEARTAQRRIEVARDLLREIAQDVANHPEHRDAARALIAPVAAAVSVELVYPLSPSLRLRSAEADIAEDLARARYDADPCEANRKAWQMAVDRQADASHELSAALEVTR